MSKRRVLVAIFLLALSPPSLLAQRDGLPPGALQERARTLCLACHDALIIVEQQLDRRAWARVMDKMVRWGTPVEPQEREPLIDYFAQHFGLKQTQGSATLINGPGAEAVRSACLGCHNAGPIVSQRLDLRGWTRIVDRMVRWGTALTPAEREVILNYLSQNYPAPRPVQMRPAPPRR